MDKLKIKISEQAYNKILNILKNDDQFDCVKFSMESSCCNPKVGIYLDDLNNISNEDKKDTIEDLNIIYPKALTEKVKEVQLVYRNSGFMIKSIPLKESTGCSGKSGSNSGCSGCSSKGSGCSGCHH
ncbi:hypothetical protein [Clostridium sp. HMP27]|uniref:hypothetical protein n=1 Tax=Clostridium sp. HMP27 TaxID=1487921 RepID=UPI00052B6B68|nr:hypothetical protein [Clostridium sp. HMP27]KGK86995.1 hypothetical protein DP68_12385 [Clostridium sp. HMP27]